MSTAVLPPPVGPVLTPFGVRTPQSFRWTCAKFYDLGDQGVFDDRRVMLIDGEILEMPLPNPAHATAGALTEEALRAVFGTGFVVRTEKPLPLSQATDPVPDVAVVVGSIRDYARAHPTTAVLVLEIADSSLDYDTDDKASLYASAGITDYWVVDLVSRQVVVFRDPAPDAAPRFGAGYATVTKHPVGQSVSPLAAPTATIAVADLLP